MAVSPYFQERIVRLRSQGKTISGIVDTLRSEGRPTTRTTVRKWVHRWEEFRCLQDWHRSGRPSCITPEMAQFLDEELQRDDELSSSELQRMISRKFGLSIDASSIRRFLRDHLDWKCVRTRTGPMISTANKQKRVEFAKMCLETNDQFNNVVWTDESSVQLRRHSQTMRVKIGKEREYKPAAKHALKVHVWAGISKRGATRICIFDQTMDAQLYIQILDNFLVPFLEEFFQYADYRFQQDNDPKHTSRLAKQFYEDKGINWWPTPASSPDINPIENVWHELKYFLAHIIKPLTKHELVEGIKTFWKERMTPEKCIRYIQHTHTVLPKVIRVEGGITGE